MAHKHWYSSKTMWFNVLTVLASIFALVTTSFSFSQSTLELVIFTQGAVNIVLRAIAGDIKSPLEKK